LAAIPASTRLVRGLSPPQAWTAALFHNVEAVETPLTAGLGVTYTPAAFHRWLDTCEGRFRFVSLDELDGPMDGGGRQRRLLVTFDDAYVSVARHAAPLLADRGIPSVFFVNAGLLDNRSLSLDNLIAAIVNLVGMAPIERVARVSFSSIEEVISSHVSQLTLADRDHFRAAIQEASGLDEGELLRRYSPYLSSEELAELPKSGMEIGNHTRSHVHCRVLDVAGTANEIVANQEELQSLTRQPVRAFAFPYGQQEDATSTILAALRQSAHTTAFLVGGRLNPGRQATALRYRVSVKARSANEAVAELDWLPVLRTLKSRRGPRADA